jgi:hypothetical protein
MTPVAKAQNPNRSVRIAGASVLLFSIVSLLMLVFSPSTIMRTAVLFIFPMTCPGFGFICLFNIKSRYIKLSFGVLLSLTITMLVAQVFLMLNLWHTELIFCTLFAISAIGAIMLFRDKTPTDQNPNQEKEKQKKEKK